MAYTSRKHEEAAGITVAELKARLAEESPRGAAWQLRALERLYQLQTPQEQEAHTTCYSNGWGFGSTDADILSAFAERRRAGHPLTSRQQRVLMKLIPRYAGQLVRLIAEDKGAACQQKPAASPTAKSLRSGAGGASSTTPAGTGAAGIRR